MSLLLLQLLLIIVLAQVLEHCLKPLFQPRVISEILAGLVLGPSVFGHFFPDTFAKLFPASSFAGLELIAQLGLILFMFTVGLHTDVSEMKRQGRKSFIIALGGMLIPFVLGSLLARPLFNEFPPPNSSFAAFCIFLGISFSITAFPVLARIINDRGIEKHAVAKLALASAAIGDAVAWMALAAAIAFVRQNGALSAITTAVASIVGILLTFTLLPQLTEIAFRRSSANDRNRFVAALILSLPAHCILTGREFIFSLARF